MKAQYYLIACIVIFALGCSIITENQEDDSNNREDDTSSDGDTDSDTGSDTGIITTGPCNGECARGEFTACTCAVNTPCEWQGNDFCEGRRCEDAGFFVHFQDIGDCCSGDCGDLKYTACTCRPDDPCGWTGDFFCDETRCIQAGIDNHFSEPGDCCDGACHTDGDSFEYNACTCSVEDRCGWSGDGVCDETFCAGVADPFFPDDDC